MMLSWLSCVARRIRIKLCRHQPPWLVLMRSDELWWRAGFRLEFRRSSDKNKMIAEGWNRARIIACPKCCGVFDEIAIGSNALGNKEREFFDELSYTDSGWTDDLPDILRILIKNSSCNTK